jgi:hypothetical protein
MLTTKALCSYMATQKVKHMSNFININFPPSGIVQLCDIRSGVVVKQIEAHPGQFPVIQNTRNKY